MKGSGSMIRQKGQESIRIWMERNTSVNGRKINNTAKVKKHGPIMPCTKASITSEKSKESVTFSGQMDQFTLDNSLITISKEKVSTNGQMADVLMESGGTIKCMEKEFLLGLMVGNMKESI